MTTRTRAEVRNRAAEFLGRKAISGSISDDLKTRLDDAYEEVYDDLKKDRLAIWTSTSDAIPSDLVPHLAALVAFNASTSVGPSAERYERIVTSASIAKPAIRRLVKPNYENLDDQDDF